MNKDENLKEKFKQALISTVKVISDDFDDVNLDNVKKNKKNYNFFEIENLNSKEDYVKIRAKTDSEALKRKFSVNEIYLKNIPKNQSCRQLYEISEKIRYESLGCQMLKGISKNINDNYKNIINLKKIDQLKSKEDSNIVEAFELYMIKNFFNIQLNDISKKILENWEKDFNKTLGKHLDYLKKNFEDQYIYNKKFSDLLKEMDIFDSENDENQDDDKTENQDKNDQDQDNNSENKADQETQEQNESVSGTDAENDLNEYNFDEQLLESESEKSSLDQIIQKKSDVTTDKEYKIFTTEFDEVAKAETLESLDEISKLRKSLDQQLISFQDIITKLANKLQRQLLAKQNRSWDFDLEEGLLDSSKLPRIIIDPYNSLSFKKEKIKNLKILLLHFLLIILVL